MANRYTRIFDAGGIRLNMCFGVFYIGIPEVSPVLDLSKSCLPDEHACRIPNQSVLPTSLAQASFIVLPKTKQVAHVPRLMSEGGKERG